MKVLKPTVLTDEMLISSTATAETILEWNSATAYAVDATCWLGRIRYQAAAANTNVKPGEETTEIHKWAETGPTNKWAMFDDVVGTSTVGASPLTVVMKPGGVDSIFLGELIGRTATVAVKDAPTGNIVYDKTIDLDGTIIESFYDWFFADFEQMTDVILTDLPGQFTGGELTVSVTATSGDASVGVCKPGKMIEIGQTQYGATVGIIDYSGKNTDAFGRTSVVERSYSKRGSFSMVTEKARFNKIFRTLAALRATPCVYIGTEAQGYEPLLIYGYFRDFSIDVAYPNHHLCSLEIEGLV